MKRRTGIQQLWYAPMRVLCNGKQAEARLPTGRYFFKVGGL